MHAWPELLARRVRTLVFTAGIIVLPFRYYRTWAFKLMLALALSAGSSAVSAIDLRLSEQQLKIVGQKVFHNECAGKTSCLVHWNQGESFPSLGIGHFIWYPTDVDAPFVESFPDLIAFMRKRSVELPPLLQDLAPFDAPWRDRAAFMAIKDSPETVQLRQFLARTSALQAEYMFLRAQRSAERVVAAVLPEERAVILRRLDALAATPGGVYALIDYVNFKGEGLSTQERYKHQGWGLLQVLQAMGEGGADPARALPVFRKAAAEVLTRRAENADRAIEKEKWLPGWLKRLETYRE